MTCWSRAALAAVISVALLTGCASSGSERPQWVAHPPQSGAETMYGVGEGVNLRQAEHYALENLAGQISTEVSSQADYQTVETGGGAAQSANERVSARVQDLSLSHFRVTETVEANNRTYALVELDRRAFVSELRRDANQLQARLDGELNNPEDSVIRQLASYNYAEPDLAQLARFAQILSALGDASNLAVQQSLVAHQSRARELLDVLQLQVYHEGGVDRRLATALRDALVDADINTQIAESRPQGSFVGIETSTREDQSFGSHIVRITTEFYTVDENGREIARSRNTLTGSSTSSVEQATENAVRQLENQLSERGLFDFLNT